MKLEERTTGKTYGCNLEEEVQRAWYMNKRHANDASEAARRNHIYDGIVIRVLGVLNHNTVTRDFHDTLVPHHNLRLPTHPKYARRYLVRTVCSIHHAASKTIPP